MFSRTARSPVARTLLAYQALWLTAVLGAARLGAGWATFASAVVLGACLASHPPPRVRRAIPAAAVGYAGDALLCSLGVFTFGGVSTALPPAWLALLWLGFAAFFPALFGWLAPRPLLTAVLGGVGGTLSYASAVHLGAADAPDRVLFLCVMPPVWAVRLLLLRAWWLHPPRTACSTPRHPDLERVA